MLLTSLHQTEESDEDSCPGGSASIPELEKEEPTPAVEMPKVEHKILLSGH